MGFFDLFKSSSSYSSSSRRSESAYDIERKAQEKNGDANYILAKTEDRMEKSVRNMEKRMKELRQKELELLRGLDSNLAQKIEQSQRATTDRNFMASIKRPDFYNQYDGSPFTLKGIFTSSYEDAESAARQALMVANSNLSRAKAVRSTVDAILVEHEKVNQMIDNEMSILRNFEYEMQYAKQNAPEAVRWLQKLIETSVVNGDGKINEEHQVTLNRLKMYERK